MHQRAGNLSGPARCQWPKPLQDSVVHGGLREHARFNEHIGITRKSRPVRVTGLNSGNSQVSAQAA